MSFTSRVTARMDCDATGCRFFLMNEGDDTEQVEDELDDLWFEFGGVHTMVGGHERQFCSDHTDATVR